MYVYNVCVIYNIMKFEDPKATHGELDNLLLFFLDLQDKLMCEI
jgi:hypothetical protein